MLKRLLFAACLGAALAAPPAPLPPGGAAKAQDLVPRAVREGYKHGYRREFPRYRGGRSLPYAGPGYQARYGEGYFVSPEIYFDMELDARRAPYDGTETRSRATHRLIERDALRDLRPAPVFESPAPTPRPAGPRRPLGGAAPDYERRYVGREFEAPAAPGAD